MKTMPELVLNTFQQNWIQQQLTKGLFKVNTQWLKGKTLTVIR